MSQADPIRFAIHKPVFVTGWHKSPTEYSIVARGRYGTRWMQRLVLWSARRLGMLRHGKYTTETAHMQSIHPDSHADEAENLRAMIVCALNDGYRRGEFEAICGPGTFQVIMSDKQMRFEIPNFATQEFGRTSWFGIPVRMIRDLEGMAILPIENAARSRISA